MWLRSESHSPTPDRLTPRAGESREFPGPTPAFHRAWIRRGSRSFFWSVARVPNSAIPLPGLLPKDRFLGAKPRRSPLPCLRRSPPPPQRTGAVGGKKSRNLWFFLIRRRFDSRLTFAAKGLDDGNEILPACKCLGLLAAGSQVSVQRKSDRVDWGIRKNRQTRLVATLQ